jgi:hypothetical protein
MSALEIEQAIRNLPRAEASDLLRRLDDLRHPTQQRSTLSDAVIAKWQVQSGFGVGLSSDEYIRLIRDGDRD